MDQFISIHEKTETLSLFMNSLRISGYDHNYRYQMIKGIVAQNERIETEIQNGNRYRYRSREQIIQMKAAKIGKHPNTWFLRGSVQNTFKIQGTPNSGLLVNVRNALGNGIQTEGGSTKIVELGGKPITTGLSNTVLFTANRGCVFQPPCTIDPEMDCRTSRCVYEVECLDCQRDAQMHKRSVYLGTTGHMMHKRQGEHQQEVRQHRHSNAMYKHSVREHQGQTTEFRSKVLKGNIKYNMDRFILESLRIQKASLDERQNIMNSRGEWGHRGLPRLQIQQQ